jgi:hypothetical protein
MRRLASALPLLWLSACAATPPANWATGGAMLDIPRARWVYGDLTVDVLPDGRIFLNGEHELNVDRGGRVFDVQSEPMALLEPDGKLLGPDDALLGYVGELHASLPGDETAWLTVTLSGEVLRYLDDGDRASFGVWMGCNISPRAHQTCTLVTHLLGNRLREIEQARMNGSMLGRGMGVGLPVR